MRQNWVGDIADFAKYGLLKRLAGTDLRLGVFWYLTTHAAANKPLVSYLSKSNDYRPYDGTLFDTLCQLHKAKGDALALEDIERNNVLPNETVFYAAPLSTTALKHTARRAARQQWFEDGYRRTQACDLIFLDPDTGLLPTSHKVDNKDGEKYARIEEVISLCRRGQSVVCIQFGRPGNLEREPLIARQRLAELRAALVEKGFPKPWGLWWPEQHKVGLIVTPNARHVDTLRERREAVLVGAAWARTVTAL